MKKLFYFAFLLVAVSCTKAPVAEITASFTTDRDVYLVGDEIFIENTTVVKNEILAFCEWEYDGEEEKQYHYGRTYRSDVFKNCFFKYFPRDSVEYH